jgi:hypothetical protein
MVMVLLTETIGDSIRQQNNGTQKGIQLRAAEHSLLAVQVNELLER